MKKLKNRGKSAITSLALCLATAAFGAADASLTNKVDELFGRWNRPDSPGAALVILKDGVIVHRGNYGAANLEHGIPITAKSVFDACSLAKQFTGLAVAMLIQQGKLSLDDDIRTHLPEMHDFGKIVTVEHLLHHTSGLRDAEIFALSGMAHEDAMSWETLLRFVRQQRELDFAPGEEYAYSGTGYILLAAIVAKVTGQSFRSWTDKNIFQPLDMKDTHFCDNISEIVANRAESYGPKRSGFFRMITQSAAVGAGSLFVTADDMGKWLLNLETGRVGAKAAIEMMLQPGKLNSGTNIDYGFGLGWSQYRGLKMITHSGAAAGYRSGMAWIPEKRLAVAVLANVADVNALGLAAEIVSLYLGSPTQAKPSEPPPRPAVTKLATSSMEAHLGTYHLAAGQWLTISREGDDLIAKATQEPKSKMTALSGINFVVDATGASIQFTQADSGRVTNVLYNGARGTKLDPLKVTRDYLAAYVGDYWSDELQTIFHFEIHDGRLAVWRRGPGWIRLLPVAPNCFDTSAGIAIEFTRNAASEIDGMILTGMSVRHLRFVRVVLPKVEHEGVGSPASPRAPKL